MILTAMALVTVAGSSGAFADPASKDAENFSLYSLASNAASYFGNVNAPGGEGGKGGAEGLPEEWRPVTQDSGDAGSMIGYADADFSFSLKWLFNEVSGSSQTLSYDTFKARDGEGNGIGTYNGLMDYAHFGAVLNDLGFDSMSSGIGGGMMHSIGGGIMWCAYGLVMVISWLFWIVIQILKLLNPFTLFHQGISAVSPAYANWADGMTDGADTTLVDGPLSGLSTWISGWYGTMVSLSWDVLVPMLIAFLLLGLVFFKKMDRGSAIKKLVIRVVFMAVGLPLVGGMYTSVLNQFDDSMLGQSSGPTKVVLSTYVDFGSWMTNNRLAVPEGASISWDATRGHAQAESMLSARNSALAINALANPAFPDAGEKSGTASEAWKNSAPDIDNPETDHESVGAVFGMLDRYIKSQSITASDFESGIKGEIAQIPDSEVSKDDRTKWFVGDHGYGDSKDFGERGGGVGVISGGRAAEGPAPTDHPIIATKPGSGLYVDNPGAPSKIFRSNGDLTCGYKVTDRNGKPADCNMSPLAAYNYLNTGFSPTELTTYSSNKATSGFTRETHDSVSQVGTGPAGFMYWANAIVLLGSIFVVGIFYAVGMLISSTKRTFGVLTAVPFAAIGAMSGIAKVIIYSVALILEVLVTLFLYQFISEFLVSIPGIIEGPISRLVSTTGVTVVGQDGTTETVTSIFSNEIVSYSAVIVMTVFSSALIIGVTIALMKVRKQVLQGLSEVVTKLVDKFLDTNTQPPTPGGSGGGVLPAMAQGVGAGAGMAAANGLAGKFGGGDNTPKPGGRSSGQTGYSQSAPTNAGGLNNPKAVEGRGQQAQLPPGGSDAGGLAGGGPDGPNGPAPVDGGNGAMSALPAGRSGDGGNDGRDGSTRHGVDGTNGHGETGGQGADGQGGNVPPDKGTAMASGSTGTRSQDDRALAQRVAEQGGLSKPRALTSGKTAGSDGVTSRPDAAGLIAGGGTKGAEKHLGGVDARSSAQSAVSVDKGPDKGTVGGAPTTQDRRSGRMAGSTSLAAGADTMSPARGRSAARSQTGGAQAQRTAGQAGQAAKSAQGPQVTPAASAAGRAGTSTQAATRAQGQNVKAQAGARSQAQKVPGQQEAGGQTARPAQAQAVSPAAQSGHRAAQAPAQTSAAAGARRSQQPQAQGASAPRQQQAQQPGRRAAQAPSVPQRPASQPAQAPRRPQRASSPAQHVTSKRAPAVSQPVGTPSAPRQVKQAGRAGQAQPVQQAPVQAPVPREWVRRRPAAEPKTVQDRRVNKPESTDTAKSEK